MACRGFLGFSICLINKNLTSNYSTYGIKHGDFRAKNIKLGVKGIDYSIGDIKIKTRIPGEFNVYNSMAAAITGQKLGLTPEQIHDGIYSLTSVEGRMNIIDEGQPFSVIVDYAHAPDALEKVFDSEKTEFLRRKKRRGNIKNDNTSLPSSMKNLINKYGDVMANIGDKDMSKYEVFKKYNKNKKSKK